MSYWDAIILGIAQGLTEFLPVSSSGHLVVLQNLLGFREPLLTFDIMVHLGTLAAVPIYYRKKLLSLVTGLFGSARAQAVRTIVLIGIATVPAVVIGLAFKDAIEGAFGDPLFVALMWFLFGILAIVSTRWTKGTREFESLSFFEAFLIGCAQSVAILPGVSRSGSTIIAGMTRGVMPAAAANFSVLDGDSRDWGSGCTSAQRSRLEFACRSRDACGRSGFFRCGLRGHSVAAETLESRNNPSFWNLLCCRFYFDVCFFEHFWKMI